MGKYQCSANSSPYAGLYDIVVPKDNRFRLINSVVDFSVIGEELLEKYCFDNEYDVDDLIMLFKYVMIKALETMSDIDVVERSNTDLSFKYFLNFLPEDDVIDAQILTRFRRQLLQDTKLLDILLQMNKSIAAKLGVNIPKSMIVDTVKAIARLKNFSLDLLRDALQSLESALSLADCTDIVIRQDKECNGVENQIMYAKSILEALESRSSLCVLPVISEKVNLIKEILEDVQNQSFLPSMQSMDITYVQLQEVIFLFTLNLKKILK